MSLPRALSIAVCALVVASATSAFALNPSRTYKQKPDKFNMEYREERVKTNDGQAELVVWNFKATKATKSTVLIAHSGEGNMGDYLRRVDALRAEHNVVTFDWRGYGESSEFEIDNNMYIYPHFQDDYVTMVDYVRKTHSATFHAYGWGALGGGLTLGVGWSRPELKTIVADTPFLSMEDLEERFSSWDEPMEVPFAGFEKRYEPRNAVLENAPGKNLAAVQIIVGSNDRLFKADDYKAWVKQHKKLVKTPWVVENPDRKDNFTIDKAAYAAKLAETFAR